MHGLGGPPVSVEPFSHQMAEACASEIAIAQERVHEIERQLAVITSIIETTSMDDPIGIVLNSPISDSADDDDGEHRRQGFSRPGNKGGNNQKSSGTPSPGGTPYQSSSNLAPRVPPLPNSPSFASSLTGATAMDEGLDGGQFKFKEPIWYNEKWTRQVVKGNFMTIVARPKIVDDGEWIAHQGMLLNIFSISLPKSFCLKLFHLLLLFVCFYIPSFIFPSTAGYIGDALGCGCVA
jgi:hypothetical protein